MAAPAVNNWQSILLGKIGAPVTKANVNYLNAWARAEGGSASNNPFNTTQPGFGATGNYNSVGVKNYADPMQGIDATAHTLENGRYKGILAALHQGTNSMAAAQALAASPWGTGSLVEKILGGSPGGGAGSPVSPPKNTPSGNLPSPLAGPQPASGGGVGDPRQMMAAMLMQAAQNGGQLDPGSLLGMAMARRQTTAAQQTYGPQPTQGPLVPNSPLNPKLLPFIGKSTQGVKGTLLQNISAAARAAGATQIKLTSGYRSPADNARVGGASHSNHMTGDAVDGFALIKGQWVPLGQALKPYAPKYGLRSGATFNWGGAPDIWHVDDGANQ